MFSRNSLWQGPFQNQQMGNITLDARHVEYLNLEDEKCRCETVFTRLERKERWTAKDDALFATTLCRYKGVLADQATLRSTTADTLSFAVNA